MKIIASVLCSMLLILYSCGLTGGETTPPSSGIYISNASPDAPALDVSLNDVLLASGYTYSTDSGYFLTAPGTYNFKVSKTGSTTSLTDELLNIPAGKYYSLFFVDSFSSLQTLFIEDKITADTFTYTKLRFFDFCPNSPTVQVIFANKDTTVENDTLIFPSRYFNDQVAPSNYTNFTPIDAGDYNISIYMADSTATLIKQFDNLTFLTGKHYTLYMKGLIDNNATPLDLAIIKY